MKLSPTDEQSSIVSLAVDGHSLVINAYAGCTKTTTCSMVAEAVVKPSLYLAFNKALADEAKEKMPKHVECRTWHSIAYQAVGLDYHHKLTRPQGAYRNLAGTGGEIARYLKIKGIELTNGGVVGSVMMGIAVKKTLTRFEFSDSAKVGKEHVDHSVIKKFKGDLTKQDKDRFQREVVKYAKTLWNLRADMNSPVLITHDTYLKLFQLSDPVLEGYDVLYSDESQDVSATMLDVLSKQKAQKIVVGDVFQKIYGWRGSVDGMGLSEGKIASLTKSFRFGQALAEVANSIIGVGRVNGCDRDTKVFTFMPESYEGKTLLFRTNAALFSKLVVLLKEGYTVSTEVDTREFRRLVESCLFLFRGEKKQVKHEDILPYVDWKELKMSIKNGIVDGNIANVCRLVESGEYLAVLGAMDNVTRHDGADVLLTTAHKAKGREWSEVVVMDDFPDYTQEGVNPEERNLYYVACTRAIDVLYYVPIEKESCGSNIHCNVSVVHSASVSEKNPLVSRIDLQMAKWGWNNTGDMESLAEFSVGGHPHHGCNHVDDEPYVSGEIGWVDNC